MKRQYDFSKGNEGRWSEFRKEKKRSRFGSIAIF